MQGQAVNNSEKKNLVIMIAAFAAVYLIWGSTYLAIKYAIETMPTFLMAGVRFTLAGAFLYALTRLTAGYEKPKLAQWRTSAIVGFMLLTIGNGAVVLGEHYISSGLTALLVATVPFWTIILGWAFFKQGSPNVKVVLGLLIGFAGVWMLLSGRPEGAESGAAAANQLIGAGIITVGSLAWALGSLFGATGKQVSSPVQAAGMQMLSGGAILLVLSAVTGEFAAFNIAAVSYTSWLALAYLVVFGAVVAYTAYSWLMKNISPTRVTTYAYINPAVAVFLGWAIAGETITSQILIGAAVIIGSVALISSQKKAAAKKIELHRSEMPECKTSAAGA